MIKDDSGLFLYIFFDRSTAQAPLLAASSCTGRIGHGLGLGLVMALGQLDGSFDTRRGYFVCRVLAMNGQDIGQWGVDTSPRN
jgi:hypothetical protein